MRLNFVACLSYAIFASVGKMNVAVVKYNAGNIYSVVHALKRLGVEPVLTDDAERLTSADCVLFPGQGEAAYTMKYLRGHRLDEVICGLKQPVLGICIGQQLLCRHTEEGNVDCLGVFDVDVKRFLPVRHEDKVPHMGWNGLHGLKSNLFAKTHEGDFVYFVHSYYVPLNDYTIATTNHIVPFSAAMKNGNFYATQFHPEKSGRVGEEILKCFLDINL